VRPTDNAPEYGATMFQVSLRSLLVFVTLCALAIVSLRFASPGWQTAVSSIAFFAFWAAAIVAIVDRGPRQVFAIGMAVSMAAYGIVLYALPREGAPNLQYHTEFNPDTGRLPTTRLLAPIYQAIRDVRWYDMTTGRIVPGYDPATQANAPGAANMTASEWPSRETFCAIGQCWWAIVLGICGGWFARVVYLRRTRERDSLAAGRS